MFIAVNVVQLDLLCYEKSLILEVGYRRHHYDVYDVIGQILSAFLSGMPLPSYSSI